MTRYASRRTRLRARDLDTELIGAISTLKDQARDVGLVDLTHALEEAFVYSTLLHMRLYRRHPPILGQELVDGASGTLTEAHRLALRDDPALAQAVFRLFAKVASIRATLPAVDGPRGCGPRNGPRPPRLASLLATLACSAVPASQRALYREEVRGDLHEMAAKGASRRRQWLYVCSLFGNAWNLRVELRRPARARR